MVIAPASVVLQASKSWKDHIIAHFHGRCPVLSRIYSDLNPVWGKHGNISIHALSQTACLILIPSEATRKWVLEVGYWQVDNYEMTAVLWSADASLELQDLTTAPTWAVLKSVPPQLYSLDGISVIASGIGEPLHTENSKLEPFHFRDTKVKVEIKLESLPPLAVIVRDTQGYSVRVNVEYPRLPPKCCNCGKFGHSLKYCLNPIQRRNFKQHQILPRVSVAATQVTMVDKDVSLEAHSMVDGMEPVADSVVMEINTQGETELMAVELTPEEVIEVPQVATKTSAQVHVEELQLVSKKKLPVSNQLARVTDFPPFAGKPSLRFLTHRVDKNKKLCIPNHSQPDISQSQSLISPASPAQEAGPTLVDPGADLEEGEIPFLPSPAAVKKAKKLRRLEAKIAQSSPSQSVTQMFSSIRGEALGRKPRRF